MSFGAKTAIVWLYLLGVAHAQDAPLAVVGFGVLPCRAILANEERKEFRDKLAQWVSGYVSGINFARGDRLARNLEDLIPDDASSRTITACRFTNHDTPVSVVVNKMYDRLPNLRK